MWRIWTVILLWGGGVWAQGAPAADPRNGRPEVREPPREAPVESWRYWWEFNREALFRRVPAPPSPSNLLPPLGSRHGETLRTLRRIAADAAAPRRVRAEALLALGRVGGDSEAWACLQVLRDDALNDDVRAAAAIALGLLPPLEGEAARRTVRDQVGYVLDGGQRLPGRVRQLLIIATGLRARDDRELVARLAAHRPGGSVEGATLALAWGLAGDPVLFPEIHRAAWCAEIGGVPLDDIGRSHAVVALGRCDDADAAPALEALLRADATGLHTRRAAALALGRLLRLGVLRGADANAATRTLQATLAGAGDVILRGFAAVALGGAQAPRHVATLEAALRNAPRAELRPFAALALGLAARRTAPSTARRIQRLLARELAHARNPDLAASLSLALGLGGATESEDLLASRLTDESLPAVLRGAAAHALGVMGGDAPRAEKALFSALACGSRDVADDAALALGMSGRPWAAAALLQRFAVAGDDPRVALALGYLGARVDADPLLDVLTNPHASETRRANAAIALGLLGDPREPDPLFAVAEDFNYHATTLYTHELLSWL